MLPTHIDFPDAMAPIAIGVEKITSTAVPAGNGVGPNSTPDSEIFRILANVQASSVG